LPRGDAPGQLLFDFAMGEVEPKDASSVILFHLPRAAKETIAGLARKQGLSLYQPGEGMVFPETPYEFNYGITYYNERYDKDGKMIMQEFGDDYNHVDSEGTRVFYDAEKLILTLEADK